MTFGSASPALEAHVSLHVTKINDDDQLETVFRDIRREVGGLFWENYRDDAIHITQSLWHGRMTKPKTRKSKGAIPIIAPLAKRLAYHRSRLGNPTSGPMFPNEVGKPKDLDNLLNRVIPPTSTDVFIVNRRAVPTCCPITIFSATVSSLSGTDGTRRDEDWERTCIA